MLEDKLIVALDISDKRKLKSLVNSLCPVVKKFKVGLIAYTAFGSEIADWLVKKGVDVFLDLKFFDIPNTVAEATKIIFKKKLWGFTLHLKMGKENILRFKEIIGKKIKKRTKIIGVTVLTSQEAKIEEVLNTEKLIKYLAYTIVYPRDEVNLNTNMINFLMAVIRWLEKHEEVRKRLKELLEV